MSDGWKYCVFRHWFISDCARTWSWCITFSMEGWTSTLMSSSRHQQIPIFVAIASNFAISCLIWHAATLPFLSALSNRGTSCRPKLLILRRKKFSNADLIVFGTPCLCPNPLWTFNIVFLICRFFPFVQMPVRGYSACKCLFLDHLIFWYSEPIITVALMLEYAL